MKVKNFKSWYTTIIGSVIGLVGIFFFFIGKEEAGIWTRVFIMSFTSIVGGLLIGASDDKLWKILEFIGKNKSNNEKP